MSDPRPVAAEVRLGYQPVVCLTQGLTHGADATSSPVGPGGPADAVEQPPWRILEQVAAEAAAVGPPVRISVSLPTRALEDDDLLLAVAHLSHRHHLQPGTLALALSGPAPASREATADALHSLRSLGCSVGVDHFGRDLDSLRRLRDLPVDFVRLDASVVAGLLLDGDGLTLAASLLARARDHGVATVATGVDGPAQAAWLADLGCDHGQGPFFGPPREWLTLPTRHTCGGSTA